METLDNLILGINRRKSGAFEHAWALAQQLKQREFKVGYFSKWFENPIMNVNLATEESVEVVPEIVTDANGVIHLHSHTWEHAGILEDIQRNPKSQLVYTLHAFLPYYYLTGEEKRLFLEGKLPQPRLDEVIASLNPNEKHQLTALDRADQVIAISQGLKTVLQQMGVNKPIHVLENVVDMEFDDTILDFARIEGVKFRDGLESGNVLLYCGRLHDKKGPAWLFESFNMVRDQYPDAKLVLLGADYSAEFGLLHGLRFENLSGIIRVPWIDKNKPGSEVEMLKHYFAADAIIQPMVTDGLFSKAVIDAMHLGIPAITCRSPYTVGSSFGPVEIAESFIFMRDNPEEVSRIINAAKLKVDRENNWDYYIRRLSEISSS